MKDKINTILVIDDNDVNRKYIETFLSKESLEIILTSSGNEALTELKHKKPNLILVDIQMPEMDGFQCYSNITELYGHFCPILAITAFSDQADKQMILNHGFNDFIQKPVKPQVLLETVLYWITNFNNLKKEEQNIDDELVDESVIQELLRFTDADSLFVLLDEFVEETKVFVQKISFLEPTNQHSEILSILHTIKGNAGSFGFSGLSQRAAKLETYLKADRFQTFQEEFEDFKNYANFLLTDYQRLINI